MELLQSINVHVIMKIQLIQGQFNMHEAFDIITQMIQVKIKYHEGKINNTENEEDIKNREAKIIRLQKELYEIRKEFSNKDGIVQIESYIDIQSI